MSIGKIQEKILTQKGCGTVIAIGMAFVMSFFVFGQCARNGSMANTNEANTPGNSNVVTVGDIPITSKQLNDAVTMATRSQPGSSFQSIGSTTSSVLTNLLTSAANQYIAKRDHLPVTDDALMKAAAGMMDQRIEMMKMQLQIRPGAPPKDVDAQFKKRVGMTPAEAKSKALDNVKTALSKPDTRADVISDLIGPLVQDELTKTMKPSDAELRSSYDTYIVKRILISRVPGQDPKVKAQEAQKALQGGMKFEDAMDKFSGEPPRPGQKVHDSTNPIPASMLSMRPSYKSLQGQKAGFVSPIVDDPEGESIYKIISITNDTPKDFDKNKDRYQKQYAQMHVQQKLQDDIKAVLDGKEVTWLNKGDQALYDYNKTNLLPPAERDAALQKVEDEAKAALSDAAAKQPALYAWYLAESALYQEAKDKSKLLQDRLDMLTAVLASTEDYELRVELTDLDIQLKKGPDAVQNLASAMEANTSYDQDGQRKFGDLSAKADSLVKLKLIKPADLKPFQDAQAAWKKSKEDEDKNDAEMKAQQAAAAAKQAQLDKENAEAMKKQKAAAKTTAPPAGNTAAHPPTGAASAPTQASTPPATSTPASKPVTGPQSKSAPKTDSKATP